MPSGCLYVLLNDSGGKMISNIIVDIHGIPVVVSKSDAAKIYFNIEKRI